MFRNLKLTVIMALVVLFSTTGAALAQEDAQWSYQGDTGPAAWGELSPDYVLCAEGTEQSPIGIPFDAESNPADLAFSYQPSALNIVNDGHTVQVNYDEGSSFELDGQTYNLSEIHFHNPGEHTAAGRFQPLELHFVHSSADGGMAVIGVLVAEGAESAALADIVANLPAEAGDPIMVDGATVDASALLPADQSYWRYDGSLTTPPCSESVKWIVMVSPITASNAQVTAIADLHRGNARPLQKMNDREFIVGQMSADMAEGDDAAAEGDMAEDDAAEGDTAEGDAAEGDAAAEGDMAEMSDIVDTAVAAGSFNTLVAAVTAAELEGALRGEGPFTVFAPTDEAFAALPEGTVEALLADPTGDLAQILLYHVVSGKVMAADVTDGLEAETLQGGSVTFTVGEDGSVMINDANVVAADIETANGVIHVIDAVILPAAEGDMAEGDAAEGDAAEGDMAEGDMAEGDAMTADAPAEMPETGAQPMGPLAPIGVVAFIALLLGGVTVFSKRRQ